MAGDMLIVVPSRGGGTVLNIGSERSPRPAPRPPTSSCSLPQQQAQPPAFLILDLLPSPAFSRNSRISDYPQVPHFLLAHTRHFFRKPVHFAAGSGSRVVPAPAAAAARAPRWPSGTAIGTFVTSLAQARPPRARDALRAAVVHFRARIRAPLEKRAWASSALRGGGLAERTDARASPRLQAASTETSLRVHQGRAPKRRVRAPTSSGARARERAARPNGGRSLANTFLIAHEGRSAQTSRGSPPLGFHPGASPCASRGARVARRTLRPAPHATQTRTSSAGEARPEPPTRPHSLPAIAAIRMRGGCHPAPRRCGAVIPCAAESEDWGAA